MRDALIVSMQKEGARRDALILRQFVFLKTRQAAFEQALSKSSLMDRLRWAVWPIAFLKYADAVQLRLLADEQRALQAAAQRPDIKVVQGG